MEYANRVSIASTWLMQSKERIWNPCFYLSNGLNGYFEICGT